MGVCRPLCKILGASPGGATVFRRAGAMDRTAHLAANRLVQNRPEAATLEITLQGPRLLFETPALISITGADFGPTLDHRRVPMWMSLYVRPGQTLELSRPSVLSPQSLVLSPRRWGRVCYIGIHGGVAGPRLLGSQATYLKANLSGYKGLGRALAAGDELESGLEVLQPLRPLSEGAGRAFPEAERPRYSDEVQLRLVRGPYEDHFSEEAYHLLFNSSFSLMAESDRMGFRLNGPSLPHLRPKLADIASCAAVFGAIQVPSNGQPIVLMADHQVTGGYPIIGTVLSADLPLLAQLLPNGKVTFKETLI